MKKNFVSKHLNSNNKPQANRKNRSLQLEALETRQLLSAASIMDTAAAANSDAYKVVDQDTFTVQSNLTEDFEGKVVAVYIQGNNNTTFALKGNDLATILGQVRDEKNDNIACLLVKMGAKSSFTLTTTTPIEEPMTVFVTHPLDLDGDGKGTELEYNLIRGHYLNSDEVGETQNSYVTAYFLKLGIDLSKLNDFPKIFDIVKEDNQINLDEWRLAKDIKDMDYGDDFHPTVTTTPQVEDLKVDGHEGTAVPEQENTFVINENPSVSPNVTFTIPETETLKINAEIVYTNADGQKQTISESYDPTGQENKITIALTGRVQENSTVAITLSYDGLTESATTYSYKFDTAAPSLVPGMELVDGKKYGDKVYSDTLKPEFKVTYQSLINWETVLAEVADPAKGIWLVLAEGENKLNEIKLTADDIDAIKNGNFTIAPEDDLENREYTLRIYAYNFAGNETTPAESTLTIDNVLPALADVQTEYYVDVNSQELIVKVTDKNLKSGTDGMTMTSDKGKECSVTASEIVDDTITYTFTLPLDYGKNIWTFTATDAAGNSATKTFTYDYNKAPVVHTAGTKLDGANIKLTTESTEVKNNKELNESVGTIADGKLNLGKVADLFTENDGSSIIADKDHVSIENLGSTVSSWDIVNDEIVLTLASFEKNEIETFRADNVKITYTDEYKESASITFDLAWTNDTAAPSVTFDNQDDFKAQINGVEGLWFNDSEITLNYTVSDANAITAMNIQLLVNGEVKASSTSTEKGSATISTSDLKDNDVVKLQYTATDEFGNTTTNTIELGTVTIYTEVHVESAEIAAINTPSTNKTPDVTVNFTNLGEKVEVTMTCTGPNDYSKSEVLYANATDTAITFTDKFKLEADGEYIFTAVLKDAAGNTKTLNEVSYVLDTLAPTVSFDKDTPTYTNDQKITLNFTASDDTSGLKSLTLYQDGAEKALETTATSQEVTLNYGDNVFRLVAVDNVGIQSETSITIEWNKVPWVNPECKYVTPEATGADFTQTLSIGMLKEGKITLNLLDYVTDEEAAKLVGSNLQYKNTEGAEAISAAEIDGMNLVMTMNEVTLDKDLGVVVTLTMTDVYNETIDLTFHFTYIYDNVAPAIKADDFAKDFTNNEATHDGNFLSKNDLAVTTRLTDDTAIVSYGWKLVAPDGTEIAGDSGTPAEGTKSVEVTFYEANKDLVEGTYVLSFWGYDGINTATTEASPTGTIEIIVDKTAPDVSNDFAVALANTTSPTAATTNSIKVTGTATDTNGAWMEVVDSFDGSTVADVKANTDGSFDDITLTNLADGTHKFTCTVYDAAGNVTGSYDTSEIQVDTTAPTINNITLDNESTEYEGRKLITEATGTTSKNVMKFTFDATDKSDLTWFYSTDGTTWQTYNATDGVAVNYGDTDFRFKVQDAAGNVTEWKTGETLNTIPVSYDHIPAATTETLASKSFDYDAEAETIEITYTKDELKAIFTDQDDDLESWSIELTIKADCGLDTTNYTWAESGDNYVLTLNVTDAAKLKAKHDVVTINSVTATDAYEQTATNSNAATISKANLAPEAEDVSTKSADQNETGVFVLDLSDCFTDPEGDTWTISSAEATNGVETAKDGQNVTVTLPEGKEYGTFQLKVKASDGTTESVEKTLDITIDWTGVTSVSLADITINENSGAQEFTATIENAFDTNKAIGGYTKSTEFTVTAGTETVNGYVVSGEGEARTRTACTALTNGYTFENGVLKFTPAKNAYGTATLTLSVQGEDQTAAVTTTTNLTINNVPSSPYAPTQNGNFTLTGDNEQTFDIRTQCDAGEDSGNVSLTSLTATGLSEGTLTITKDNHTYTLTVAKTDDGFTVKRDKIDGQPGDDKAWEALNGESVAFSYVIHNDSHTDNTKDATGTYNLTLNAIAKTVTLNCDRAQEEQSEKLTTEVFTEYEGYYVSAVTPKTSVTGITATLDESDHSVTVVIKDGVYGNAEFTYTLTNGTDTYTASIFVNVACVNFAPVQKDGVLNETSQDEKDTAYVWTVNGEEYDFRNAFEDPYDKTDLTIELSASTITDGRTGFDTKGTVTYDAKTGKVTFTPDDKDFNGTVAFTLTVTDQGVEDQAAESSTFDFTLTINNTADAPLPIENAVLTVSGKAGDVVDLSTLKSQFYSPDGNTIASVKYNGSETYTIPEDAATGVHYLTGVQVADSENLAMNTDITLLVNGTVQFTDLSLYAKETQTNTYSGKLSASKTLSSDVELTAETKLALDSVIESGSTLAAGSSLAAEAIFGFAEFPSWLEGATIRNAKGTSTTTLTWDAGSSSFVGTLGSNDYKLTWDGTAKTLTNASTNEDGESIKVYFGEVNASSDITLVDGSFSAISGSTLKAGTVLAMNSTLGQSITIEETLPSTEEVKKMYIADRVETEPGSGTYGYAGLLLREELDSVQLDETTAASLLASATATDALVYNSETGTGENKTLNVVSEVSVPDGAGKSQYKYITVEDGKLCLYYSLYNIDQNRADRTFTLNINGGELEITTSVVNTDTRNNDCVTPYEINFKIIDIANSTEESQSAIKSGVSATFDTSDAISIDDITSGSTYVLMMYVRNNLPLYSSMLGSAPYETWSAGKYQALFEITGVSGLTASSTGLNETEITNEETGEVTFTSSPFMIANPADVYDQYQVCTVTFTSTGNTKITATEGREVTPENIFYTENTYFQLTMDYDTKAGPGQSDTRIDTSQISAYFAGKDNLKGTSAAEKTVVEGNGIYMSLVKEKSGTATAETLPESCDYITEWDTSYLELWLNTQEAGTNISNFKFDVNYDSSLFTASDQIEYSSFVNGGSVTFENGCVKGISGELTNAVTNEDGFVLVARVKLAPVDNGGITAETLTSVSPNLSLENIELRSSDGQLLDVNTQTVVNTKVFAVVYDANDDGKIDIDDLVLFAKKYNTDTTVSTDTLAWALDFDNNGKIDIDDLVYFAKNFRASQARGSKILYPTNFFQTWIGTTLEMSGDSNVADTLEDAINGWSEKLEEELNLNVQIIVKEYANVENGVLAEVSLLECDENGKPDTAVIYLDSDALGKGWYVGESDNVQAEQYDLYSVLLHELGHALGMSSNYSGYNDFAGTDYEYRDENNNVCFVFDGHVYGNTDLMNTTFDVGVRYEISEVDVAVVKGSRDTGASNDGHVCKISKDSLLGTEAETTNFTTVVAVSSIMPEEEFNQMLVEVATKAVMENTAKRVDTAWQEFETGEKEEINLSTAATDDVFDSMFDDEDFASVTNEIARENLTVELNEK